jgi:hypothetical protein
VLPGQSTSVVHGKPVLRQNCEPSRHAQLVVPSGCKTDAEQVGSSGRPRAEPPLPWLHLKFVVPEPVGQSASTRHGSPLLGPAVQMLFGVVLWS